jgi:hypothetical protein
MIRTTILLIILAGSAFADTLTLDTLPLETSGTGPFTIDFQFDSGALGGSNNTVTLTDFLLGGGSIGSSPTSVTGGVSSTTSPFSVSLTTVSSFYNDIEFAFTPGSSLSFDISSTTNVDPVAPDTFTFAIFDGTGNEIPTTNPNLYDSFFELDLPGPSSPVTTITSGSAGYSADIAAPTYTSGPAGGGSVVPEPSALPLIGMAGAILVGLRLRKGRP